jgi:hypothetical protein
VQKAGTGEENIKKGEISVWFRGVLIAQIHSTTIERILNFKRFDAFAIGGN